MERSERRQREAQRAAVGEVLPDAGQGSVLRMANGEVLIYDEGLDKRRPIRLRAVVMPDGRTQVFPTNRFRRSR